MSFMNTIRKNKTAVRVPLILVIVALAVGLVGFFAVGSVPDMVPSSASDQGINAGEDYAATIKIEINRRQAILKANPDNAAIMAELADYQHSLGVYYYGQGNFSDAVRYLEDSTSTYRQLSQLNKDDLSVLISQAVTQYDLGHSYFQAGNLSGSDQAFQNSVTTYQKVVALDPQNAGLLQQLANTQYDLGVHYRSLNQESTSKSYFSSAVENYQKVLAIEPDNLGVTTDMATAAYLGGQLDLAEGMFKEALARDYQELGQQEQVYYIYALINYGIFLDDGLNQPERAREQWERALSLNPTENQRQQLEQLL